MADCIVCKRIKPKEIFEQGHLLLNKITDKETIRKINLDAIRCINHADKQYRIFFCGLSSKTLLAGLFYLLCPKYGFKITLALIWEITDLTEVTICRSYHKWVDTFPELFPEWESCLHKFAYYHADSSDGKVYHKIAKEGKGWRLRKDLDHPIKEIGRRDLS
jgi:hypothetical protein